MPALPKSSPEEADKYRRIDAHTKQIFTEQSLYFPGRAKFNDPFDCRVRYNTECTLKQYRKVMDGFSKIKAHLASLPPRLREEEIKRQYQQRDALFENGYPTLEKFHDETGVLCLCEVRDQFLMWSHYADCHRGICLEFNTVVGKSLFGHAQRVNYGYDLPVYEPYSVNHEMLAQKALFRKAPDWKYEKEWRVIGIQKANQTVVLPSGTLMGVIFGVRACGDQKAEVRKWCECLDPVPTIYEARLKEDAYGLDIVEVPS